MTFVQIIEITTSRLPGARCRWWNGAGDRFAARWRALLLAWRLGGA
jgi:hypothetical protein